MNIEKEVEYYELGVIANEEDLQKAITAQLKTQGYSDDEVAQWFEEADSEIED